MTETGKSAKRYLTAGQVRARYGNTSEMSLWRWLHHPTMGFPQPLVINRRRFWDEAELDAFDLAHAAAQAQTMAPENRAQVAA